MSETEFVKNKDPNCSPAEKTLSRLKKYQESGRSIPEFPGLPFREVIVRPCKFFYRIKDDAVWIVAVWHSSRLAAEPAEK